MSFCVKTVNGVGVQQMHLLYAKACFLSVVKKEGA